MSISIQAVETYLTLSKQTVWVQKLYIKERFLEPQNNDLIVTLCDVRHLEKVLLDELFQNVTGVFTDVLFKLMLVLRGLLTYALEVKCLRSMDTTHRSLLVWFEPANLPTLTTTPPK